jgi:hypothetical protein
MSGQITHQSDLHLKGTIAGRVEPHELITEKGGLIATHPIITAGDDDAVAWTASSQIRMGMMM